MNELITVYDYIKSVFDSDNTNANITRVPFEDIGIIKNALYPFVNVDYTGVRYENGLIIFKFTIYALAKRDVSKQLIQNWWDNQDNKIDNQIATENILRRFIFTIENLQNDFDIEMISRTELQSGSALFLDMLDGHSFDVEFGITNEIEC